MNTNVVYFKSSTKMEEVDSNAVHLIVTSPPYFNKKVAVSEPLNKKFYSELLYILGLREVKKDGKIVIRQSDTENSLYHVIEQRLKKFDKKHDFETIIQLIIVWLSRILFLKVFEHILVKANNFDSKYKFLCKDKIKSFSDLNELFFDVLAVPETKRDETIKNKFGEIPYLNSSLFEPHELELSYLRISDLPSDVKIKFYPSSVIKTKDEKIPLIEYLVEFLDYYQFYEKHETTEIDKTIISPAVLGLVFEKINGYRDGSYYTKTEITGHMSVESINNYLVENVKEKGFAVSNFNDLCSLFDRNIEVRNYVIELLKKIKIIDPAVGSGHFLVSALDYLVYLYYCFDVVVSIPVNLRRRFQISFNYQDYSLQIKDTYNAPSYIYFYQRNNDLELQEFQKYIFNLKKHIIENCLFGVDINPNSVEIARLRLWIELLKNSYYTGESNFTQMEVLPNIDINITTGNSLIDTNIISKRQLTIDFDKDKFKEYRSLFTKYVNAVEIDKKTIKQKIRELKEEFYNSEFSFMIEFPHTVDNDGKFTGFSVVLMNPPYIRNEEIKPEKYKEKLALELYKDITNKNKTADLYVYFMKLGYDLLSDLGCCWIITSNKWFRAKYGQGIRKFLKENTLIKEIIDFGGKKVFDVPTVDVSIIGFVKKKDKNKHIITTVYENNVSKTFEINQINLSDNVYILTPDTVLKLKEKIEKIGKPLRDWNIKIYRGILTGYNEAFIIDTKTRDKILSECKTEAERKITEELIKPILRGKDIDRYCYKWNNQWMIIIPAEWTNKENKKGLDPEEFFKETLPSIYNHLKLFSGKVKGRKKGLIDREDQGDYWWELRPCDYYSEFEKEKIVWQRVTQKFSFCLVPEGFYILDSMAFLIGNNAKYLIALLNSKLINFYIKTYVHQYADTGFLLSNQYVEKIPIPPITEENQPIVSQIEFLIDQILTLKKHNCLTDTSPPETEIDNLVFKLYDLTQEEIEKVNFLNK